MVIGCILFASQREQAVVETTMDVFAPKLGDVRYEDYFEKDSAPNKKSPGGPTCTFQGGKNPSQQRY